MSTLFKEIFGVAVLVGRALAVLRKQITSTVEQAEEQHRQRALLAAHRLKNSWKKSDLPGLQSLGITIETEDQRKLGRRGRPVVQPHKSLSATIIHRLSAVQPLFDPASSPHQRRRALKLWPWWPHFVEALYRGELDRAKARRVAHASDHAEELVGAELNISASQVHRICGKIRRLRKEWDGAANFPAMTLDDFKDWMTTGENSWAERLLQYDRPLTALSLSKTP
jgi:hypothetical protein